MSQEQEADFRVTHIEPSSASEPTIHLQDLRLGKPVLVELESEDYSDSLVETLQGLAVGNKLHARIASEDYIGDAGVSTDGLWYFSDLEILTRTKFSFIDSPSVFPDSLQQLCDAVDQSNQGLLHRPIKSDDDQLGMATAFPVSHEPDAWQEICNGFRLFEPAMDAALRPESTPPFEVIFLRVNDEQHIVTLHLEQVDTAIAKAIRDS